MQMLQEKSQELINDAIRKCGCLRTPSGAKDVEFEIHTANQSYRIVRLLDKQYEILAKKSVTIDEDLGYLMDLAWSSATIYSNLSKMDAILTIIFGDSGDYYDHWKGAFSFPFLIRFCEGSESRDYVMNFQTVRTSVEFCFQKVLRPGDHPLKRGILHSPTEDFPKSEMQLFKRAFLDYLTNEFQNHRHKIYSTAYFKAIESNLILFGWCYGHDFCVVPDSKEEYDKMVSCLTELWQQNGP